MQLRRRPVLLPLPQHAHSLAQPIDSRIGQHNRHTPITHHRAMSPHPGFRYATGRPFELDPALLDQDPP